MICKVCGAEKPHDSFYASNKATCKECVKARMIHRRKTNPAVQEYDRKRGNRLKPEDHAAYRLANPAKYKAHTAVNNAVRDKRLIKLDRCEECMSNFRVEGHHDDYSKPLEVRWLCSRCHSLWHAEHGEALNP